MEENKEEVEKHLRYLASHLESRISSHKNAYDYNVDKIKKRIDQCVQVIEVKERKYEWEKNQLKEDDFISRAILEGKSQAAHEIFLEIKNLLVKGLPKPFI